MNPHNKRHRTGGGGGGGGGPSLSSLIRSGIKAEPRIENFHVIPEPAFQVDVGQIVATTNCQRPTDMFFKNCLFSSKSAPGDTTTPIYIQTIVNKQLIVMNEGGKPIFIRDEPEAIYDSCWVGTDHVACIAYKSSIHLYSAYNNKPSSVATYSMIDAGQEPISAISIGARTSTGHLFAGLKNAFYMYNVERPGPPCTRVCIKQKCDGNTLHGLVSTFCFQSPNPTLMGMGTLGGFALVYDSRQRWGDAPICWGRPHPAGVTQLTWSPCGNMLWCGGRRSQDIKCFDIRNTKQFVTSVSCVPRNAPTAQRIYFSLHPSGKFLATGNGLEATVFDARGATCTKVWGMMQASVVNSMCFGGNDKLVLACGSRWVGSDTDDDSSSNACEPPIPPTRSSTLVCYDVKIPD